MYHAVNEEGRLTTISNLLGLLDGGMLHEAYKNLDRHVLEVFGVAQITQPLIYPLE